jgi:hypothetical protein
LFLFNAKFNGSVQVQSSVESSPYGDVQPTQSYPVSPIVVVATLVIFVVVLASAIVLILKRKNKA